MENWFGLPYYSIYLLTMGIGETILHAPQFNPGTGEEKKNNLNFSALVAFLTSYPLASFSPVAMSSH
jgi:hypothetical protein